MHFYGSLESLLNYTLASDYFEFQKSNKNEGAETSLENMLLEKVQTLGNILDKIQGDIQTRKELFQNLIYRISLNFRYFSFALAHTLVRFLLTRALPIKGSINGRKINADSIIPNRRVNAMYKMKSNVPLYSIFIIVGAAVLVTSTYWSSVAYSEGLGGGGGPNCEGPFKSKNINQGVLRGIEKRHAEWLKKYSNPKRKDYKDPLFGNLCGSNYIGKLFVANVMPYAHFHFSKLKNTSFLRANLAHTIFYAADLEGACFDGTDISDANFSYANMKRVVFEPNRTPSLENLKSARNLEYIRYLANPDILFQLRESYRKVGRDDLARKLTHAIERRKTRIDLGQVSIRNCLYKPTGRPFSCMRCWLNGVFRLIFFEWTVMYGMEPSRALVIMIGLIPLFAIPYGIVQRQDGYSGIWRTWPEDRIYKKEGSKIPERLTKSGISLVSNALYFSLLSAFRVGWRDLNVGTWLSRMQFQEYNYRPTGWVRTLSGLQSIVSVYLVALWVLSYFGNPF